MFNFIRNLFSSDPEKKEKRRIEKEERARLRAQRKHDQRIASKQILSDEWHPVNFPYQATITEILELMYEKRPGILRKLLGVKAKRK